MTDQEFMEEAFREAQLAKEENEVPIGAVVVKDGIIIARAHNTREQDSTVLSHAEIKAIDLACKALNRWILDDCELYVTVEPCLMCAGAISQSRIKRLVYGVESPKYGANTTINAFNNPKLFHSFTYNSGIMEEEIGNLMKDFFKTLR